MRWVEPNLKSHLQRKEADKGKVGMNGRGDENHPIMGSAGGEPAPIISFFIGIITIIIALQRLPASTAHKSPLVSSTARPWPSQGDLSKGGVTLSTKCTLSYRTAF